MKKHLLSPPQSQHTSNEVELFQSYPARSMQNQEAIAESGRYAIAHALIQKINQVVVNSTATAVMLQEVAHIIGSAFNVDCCCLVTITADASREATAVNWCGEKYSGLPHPDELSNPDELPINLPVVQCASEPLTIEDISIIQKSLVIGCQYLPLPIKSVLALTTRFGGHANGVISLIKFQHYDWHESEKELIKAIESSCAIVFSQVNQAQIIANQQQYLHIGNQHQSLIKQLTILNRSNLELNQMLQLVISSTAESLEADRGLLVLLKYTDPLQRNHPQQQIPKAKANIVAEWHKNKASKFTQKEQSFSLSECGLCQRVFTDSGKPVIINDYKEHKENWTPHSLFAPTELSATLLIPLESQGKILGFVVLQQVAARCWQSPEINLVEMVCAQIGNAIIQSQTMRQVQTLVDERTEQLKRSLEVQAKLYERTRQYVEQLQQLNELKDEFVSNISDRLRYPLTNMLMSIKNLRLPGIPAERQAKYLDILESECTKEINLINDILTLQKLESHTEAPQLEAIDLSYRIQQIADGMEQKLVDRGLSISVKLPKQPLKLKTEVESFDRILQELLTNACKYSERSTTIQLQVTHRVVESVDQAIIKVTNTGRGISEEEATYIFDKFRRGKGRWVPGTGLGLALVKSLAQHLNGTIAVESKPITGSHLSEISFTLTLPQFSANSPLYSESEHQTKPHRT